MANQSPTLGPVYDALCVADLLGIRYTPEELASFGPPPEPVEGFLTFFDPGWSVLRLRNAVATKGTVFYPQAWYDSQTFATLEAKPGYRQLRIDAVKDSFRKTFAAQQTLLPPNEEVPQARVVLMGMVLHFLVTGLRLFPDHYVRCSDQGSVGDRVYVGYFAGAGLRVSGNRDGGRGSGLGLASSRKVP